MAVSSLDEATGGVLIKGLASFGKTIGAVCAQSNLLELFSLTVWCICLNFDFFGLFFCNI